MSTKTHKFDHEQRVAVDNDTYKGVVEVVVQIGLCCRTHGAPLYGCRAEDKHFSFCEEMLSTLQPSDKRKMN